MPATNDILSQLSVEGKENVPQTENNEKLWSHENILFLIQEMKDNYLQFNTGYKKPFWQKVSKKFKTELNRDINGLQCQTKWKELLKKYKAVVAQNKSSGNQRETWVYFESINEVMHNKPEITPVATCSNLTGLINNKSPGSSFTADDDSDNENSSFVKKRRLKVSSAEKRHKDKMARFDKFNQLFEKFIDKMP